MDNTDKIKIDIAGRGNVAEHLRQAFGLNEERADTAIVDPHTLDSLRTDADFIIICVTFRAWDLAEDDSNDMDNAQSLASNSKRP